MKPEDRDEMNVQRIERITEIPMLLLALAYIPVFIVSYMPDVSPSTHEAARIAEYLIIAAFAAELLVKLVVAERKIAFLRSHWLDVVIVLLPFLRPLRFLEVARVLPFLLRGAAGLRRILGPYHGVYVLLIGSLAVFIAAIAVAVFEERANGQIQGFGDALWWAIVTITTVGYGDVAPVTLEGRIVAALLMVVGIALFSILTAGIAAFFVETTEDASHTEQDDRLIEVLTKLEAIEKRIEEQHQELRWLKSQPRVVEDKEALSEPRESPETAADEPEGAKPSRSSTESPQKGAEKKPW
jgi:voltage-gated potassium channel